MTQTTNTALIIPLDDRPVTYVFPAMIAETAGIEVVSPPRSLMGSIFHPAQMDSLFAWITSTLDKVRPQVMMVGLDSLLYGGLITSRRCDDSMKAISKRLANLKKWKGPGGSTKIYAQTSIMRISDNYDNSEEKTYWARYGREIFAWSTVMYRMSKGIKVNPGILESYETRIPQEIRDDYLDTRFRNFQINQEVLDLVGAGVIDRLVLSIDDSGAQGLNVLEKEKLVAKANSMGLGDRVFCYPGADEVLCSLFAAWLVRKLNELGLKLRAQVSYSPGSGVNCPSRYEGQTIGETISAQLEAIGIQQVESLQTGNNPNNIDIAVLVHGGDVQGDHILLPGTPDLRQLETGAQVEQTLKLLSESTTPVILCDVAYANGADPFLVEELLNRPDLMSRIISYAGWNTTGNTVGSALATGVSRLYSVRTNGRSEHTDRAFQKCLFTRLADDWAYQSLVRSQLDSDASIDKLAQLISPFLGRIGQSMRFEPGNLRVSFPWKRTFEFEVCFEDR
ncbi:MAG: DUF4127 family protein [Candidatus Obscuribacterales bacterium]